MVQIPLQEVVAVHTDALAHRHEEFVLLIRLLRLLSEEASVSPEQLRRTIRVRRLRRFSSQPILWSVVTRVLICLPNRT